MLIVTPVLRTCYFGCSPVDWEVCLLDILWLSRILQLEGVWHVCAVQVGEGNLAWCMYVSGTDRVPLFSQSTLASLDSHEGQQDSWPPRASRCSPAESMASLVHLSKYPGILTQTRAALRSLGLPGLVFVSIFVFIMQHLWEETVELKNNLEDMEKKLVEGKMEIERTLDDYLKLKVYSTLTLYFLHSACYCSLLMLVFFPDLNF